MVLPKINLPSTNYFWMRIIFNQITFKKSLSVIETHLQRKYSVQGALLPEYIHGFFDIVPFNRDLYLSYSLLSLSLSFFFPRYNLHSMGWSWTQYLVQASLKLGVILPQSSTCWDHRPESSQLVWWLVVLCFSSFLVVSATVPVENMVSVLKCHISGAGRWRHTVAPGFLVLLALREANCYIMRTFWQFYRVLVQRNSLVTRTQ